MFAAGRYLYVVETNRGMLLRVDPRKGVIELAYDMLIDNAEHNPDRAHPARQGLLRRHLRR
jgi:hypothetical protein